MPSPKSVDLDSIRAYSFWSRRRATLRLAFWSGPGLSLPGIDSRPWSPPCDWFVMLATTRMTKSFKMVLLRVLLDNDAVFSGMPIPELAAKCREFLVAHEFLRRDIADAATGQPVEMSPRKWESSWRKFPISIWMQEQEGRSWFAIAGALTIVGEFSKLVMRP